MKSWNRLLKVVALVACGGAMFMWGAGSCLPYNFYSGLLGDAVIATIVSTISGTVASNLVATE
jgi:hypothetical protein